MTVPAIFDAGIFDSGIFKTTNVDPGIFDTGIFDNAEPFGIFDHLEQGTAVVTPPQPVRGGGAPIWSEVSWFKKKKKPKKEDLVEEVAAVVEQALPQVTEDESRAVALRLLQQITYEQLRRIQTLEAFIARIEAELAEMDDEEVLLLAA